MNQTTNNQNLLRTLALCAAVAGLEALPAIARCPYASCQLGTPLERLEARQDWLERKLDSDRHMDLLRDSLKRSDRNRSYDYLFQ